MLMRLSIGLSVFLSEAQAAARFVMLADAAGATVSRTYSFTYTLCPHFFGGNGIMVEHHVAFAQSDSQAHYTTTLISALFLCSYTHHH